MLNKIFGVVVSYLDTFRKKFKPQRIYSSKPTLVYSHFYTIIYRIKSLFKRRKVLKLKFLFQLPLQNIFPESISEILSETELIDFLQLRPIVVEYLELPLSYLPDVSDGEYICDLNSKGIPNESALFNVWPKNPVGQLQEVVNILADFELIYREGDYKQFVVKPKRFIDVIDILKFDHLDYSHNLGLFKSTSTGAKYYKQL